MIKIMLNSFYYVICFLILITVIVFVHEFGHYLAAKKAGVKILKFSIGMGPELFGVTDKFGTRWSFSLLPIGGYVMMLGDEDISSSQSSETINQLSDEDKKKAFHLKSNWQKMWISFCGPFANYIYAFVVMIGVFIVAGVPVNTPEIDTVLPGSPAQMAGLMKGDVVKRINDVEITRSDRVIGVVNSQKTDKLKVIVMRDGKELSFDVTPTSEEKRSLFGKKKGYKYIGVAFDSSRYEKVGVFKAIQHSFMSCVDTTIAMFKLFRKLFSGQQSIDNLGGFVYMASITGDIAKSGNIIMLLMFTVTISLNLGFINLLPFPVVDGGNILVNFIEQCLGRPINRKIMDYIMSAGAICLIFLMLLTTLNDILRLKVVNDWFSALFN